ncbi:uncharacterized protein LOC106948374 isoform X4 [Poecilia latipinna]|uniref:uncharacterized protein LOC106948374 isoform X4 n=1 Tax=Poecilia latipinna TaxID=48699 RepID=UPI00072EEF96|nr:PREDICTED: uncharacterized protein LOC106948374 isoform X4 [Poecilia latipinna]
MAAFGHINISFLLTLILLSKAQSESQSTNHTVRVGSEVTMPCGNRTDTEDKSDQTLWIFRNRRDRKETTLVELPNSHMEIKTMSDRLSVTANGSLHLYNVTEDDGGQYDCEWTTSGQKQRFVAHLSIIDMIELENPENVILFCSVLEYDACLHEVKWLYEGKGEKPSYMVIYPHSCSATVTFPTSHLHQKLEIYPFLTCNVTNSVTEAVELFPVSPQVSEENQTKTTKGDKTTNSADFPPASFPWWYIIVPLCLAMVLMAVLVIIRWNRNKGNKTQTEDIMVPQNKAATKQDLNLETSVGPETSQNTIEPEDGLSYASINFKKSKKKTGNVLETVIYSAVGTSSSSAGVSSDTDCLYSAVNKK